MRIPIILAILATTTLGSTARADFVITSPPPAADPPVVPGPQPRMPAYPVHPTSTRFKIAYGFGHQVPLSFAVRQIVPPAITVTYRPGTDPNALVDWRGGQTWNRVLFAAVKPLSLRLVVTDTKVEIRK